MKYLVSSFFFVFACLYGSARSVRVGIFSGSEDSRFQFHVQAGNYTVGTSDSMVCTISKGDSMVITDSSGCMRMMLNGRFRGVFKTVTLAPVVDNATLRIVPGSKSKSGLMYRGEIQVSFRARVLALVNTVDLESYVAGVVESEIGREVYPEMVKVQAILVRTYAISNLNRHGAEGFSLCDKVHCQVYSGVQKYHAGIRKPVLSTRDLVVVNDKGQLALTVYHSNCGGQTVNASDVWSGDISNLHSVTDTFCKNAIHAKWEKRLSRNDWERYLSTCGIRDTVLVNAQLNEAYVMCSRTCCLAVDSVQVPLKNIRKEFDLKSSLFCVSSSSDTVLLSGRGYGHGVGLCQEGANVMAENGFAAERILKYYYKDVKVVRSSEIATSRK